MNIPNGLTEIRKVYGDPDRDRDFTVDADFVQENLVKTRLPFPLRLSWDHSLRSYNVYGHKLVTPLICKFFEEVTKYYGGYEELRIQDLDIWGGCYQFRAKRGGKDLSVHSWGIAFDYLDHLGPYGRLSVIPDPIIVIGEKLGFENGRDWNTPDGMHFQLCRGY